MKSWLRILATTCEAVGMLIPPVLRLGLTDQAGCVVVGAVIGIVVAFRSMSFGAD